MDKIKRLTRLSYLLVAILCILFAAEYINKIYKLESKLVDQNLQFIFKNISASLDTTLSNADSSLTILENLVQQRIKGKVPFRQEDFIPTMAPLISTRKNQFNIYFAFDQELSRRFFQKDGVAFTLHKNKDYLNSEQYNRPETFIREVFHNPSYLSDPTEVWFHDGKKSHGVEVTDIYFDKSYMKVWMFSIVKGIYDGNKFRGVVGVDFFIENLLKNISLSSKNTRGTLALVDNKTKRVFYYASPESQAFDFTKVNLDTMLAKDARNVEIETKDGQTYILNSTYLEDFRWSIVSLIPQDVIYTEVFSRVNTLLAVCVILIGLNLLFVHFLFKYLNRSYFDIITQNQSRGITRLTEGLCHEINNPLATLSLCLGAIKRLLKKEGTENSTINGLMTKSERASDRIQSIIEKLRSISMSSTEIVLRPTSVADIIDELKMIYSEDLARFNIKCSFEAQNGGIIICDPLKLLQAMMPLMENSIEEISSLKERWIRIELEKNKTLAIIRFIDSGTGIKSGNHEKLFLPFFTTKTKDLRKGLGLTIAKSSIEQQGGEITIDTQARNTTFVISLPLQSLKEE